MAGLYVHIPFCASRCIYCGFYSTVGTNLQEQYVDALISEYHILADKQPFNATWDTIYLGGGTPSTLSPHLIDRLLGEIATNSGTGQGGQVEITIETNPDDVTPEFAAWLRQSPVNRVSMGAQTFSDERLRWLNRRHTSRQVHDAVSLLRQNGIGNISIDLMFGFPGQTLNEWEADIDRAIALAPEHISAYSLMYEEDTPLFRMLERGEIREIDDELSLVMFQTLVSKLTAAGYEHYEISNFAKPGFRSRHNSSYWRQVPYLGIGAAAHSYDGNYRWWNMADIRKYINSIAEGKLPQEREYIDERTRYNDIVTTALRTSDGIALDSLSPEQLSYIMEQSAVHLRSNRMAITSGRLHLTSEGIFVSDDIMSDLIMLE